MKIRTHYDNLKVSVNAPLPVIKAAYESLFLEYRSRAASGDEKAIKIIEIIDDAFKVLSDPIKRKKHDKWISEQKIKQKSSTDTSHNNNRSDLDLVISASKKYEDLLERHFNAEGKGLHEKVNSIEHLLDENTSRSLRIVATMRNKLVHEAGVREIPDRAKFIRACNNADTFFVEILKRNGIKEVVTGDIVLKGGPWQIQPTTLDRSPYFQSSSWVSYFHEKGFETEKDAAYEADRVRQLLSFKEAGLLDNYKIKNLNTGACRSYTTYYESNFVNIMLNIAIFFITIFLLTFHVNEIGFAYAYLLLSPFLIPIIRIKLVRPIIQKFKEKITRRLRRA